MAGKVALITGAASGIGKATAAEFVRRGATVIIADVRRQPGEDVAAELGPAASFVHCDVTDESSVAAAVDLAVDRHGRLDVAFNNAGICGSANPDPTAVDLAELDHLLSVNVRGAFAGVKHAARVMTPRRSGCILVTASVTGILGGMAPLAYSVSKSAVAGLVRAAAPWLAARGVRVNCISPFAIPTRMSMEGMEEAYPALSEERRKELLEGAGVLAGAACAVEDVAKAAAFLASEDAKYISGHNLVVDGGLTVFKRLDLPHPSAVL